ncbi:hypothetical protein VSR69_44285 [Paraburkholderia phytofirmans]
MKTFLITTSTLVITLAAVLGTISKANAEEFIGFGQGGIDPGWGVINYPTIKHTPSNTNSISTYAELAYYTPTGFTGTKRDQFEFWVGTNIGYQNTHGMSNGSPFGVSFPGIGIEYYYGIIQPRGLAGSPGYVSFWTSPTLSVAFPNGSAKSAGFGAGANQFSYGFSDANYIQIGRFAATINPIAFNFASRDLNATSVGNGGLEKLRGGLSVTLMDAAVGYQATNELFLGIHHEYNIFNMSASDFKESREASIGPSFTFLGFAKQGLYLNGNLDFDYYTSPGLRHSVAIALAIAKTL